MDEELRGCERFQEESEGLSFFEGALCISANFVQEAQSSNQSFPYMDIIKKNVSLLLLLLPCPLSLLLISPIRLTMAFILGSYPNVDFWALLLILLSHVSLLLFVTVRGSSGICVEMFVMRSLGFVVHSDLQENVAADQEEPKESKSTSTPPSTPVRAEEGKLS